VLRLTTFPRPTVLVALCFKVLGELGSGLDRLIY
jgi:hypothetical protein